MYYKIVTRAVESMAAKQAQSCQSELGGNGGQAKTHWINQETGWFLISIYRKRQKKHYKAYIIIASDNLLDIYALELNHGGMRKLRCRLRILMAEQDPPLTQKELANELSLGPNTVNKLYNNSFKRIDAETVEKLCHFFSCNINELFELKIPVSRNPNEMPKRER